eukprot:5092019-Amphidinium_carterae.1
MCELLAKSELEPINHQDCKQQVEEVVEVHDSNAAMAADCSKPQHESYAHLFVDFFGDLEAFEQDIC